MSKKYFVEVLVGKRLRTECFFISHTIHEKYNHTFVEDGPGIERMFSDFKDVINKAYERYPGLKGEIFCAFKEERRHAAVLDLYNDDREPQVFDIVFKEVVNGERRKES